MQDSTKKYLLVLYIVISLFSACNENKKKIKSALLEKLNYRVDLIDTLKSYSLNNGWIERKNNNCYKIISYVNGECGSCIYELLKWEDLISEFKTFEVEFEFFVKTFDFNQLIGMLDDIDFTQPIIIDRENTFYFKNSLSEDKRFQTFLVNNKNEVILVGNPIHNDKIKKLYFQLLNSNLKK